jgi:hypothetical protein
MQLNELRGLKIVCCDLRIAEKLFDRCIIY